MIIKLFGFEIRSLRTLLAYPQASPTHIQWTAMLLILPLQVTRQSRCQAYVGGCGGRN
jgi:hypothetical protein